MIKKLIHYCDVLCCWIHKFYWDFCALFGRVHGVVLMYHYITNEIVDTRAGCMHKPEELETTILRLKKEGYNFVSIGEMLEIIGRKECKKFAVITFDDIRDDVFINAYPILKKYNTPYTIFVSPKFVDCGDGITKVHLLEMDKDALCTVGAHGMTHCNLSKSKNLREEIEGSKLYLEKLLGHQIDYFAYPFGKHEHVSPEVKQLTKRIGFKCAFGTIDSPVSDISSKDLFYLPRKVLRG